MFESTLSKVALGGVALVVGFGSGLVSVASAQTATNTAATTPSAQHQLGNFDPSKGSHIGKNGTEVLLAGDDATKAQAAELAAVPGGHSGPPPAQMSSAAQQ